MLKKMPMKYWWWWERKINFMKNVVKFSGFSMGLDNFEFHHFSFCRWQFLKLQMTFLDKFRQIVWYEKLFKSVLNSMEFKVRTISKAFTIYQRKISECFNEIVMRQIQRFKSIDWCILKQLSMVTLMVE